MAAPDGNKNRQLIAVGIVLLAVTVAMVGSGIPLMVLPRRVDVAIIGAVLAVGGILGPGIFGVLMIRSGNRRVWNTDSPAHPPQTGPAAIAGPTAKGQKQLWLILTATMPPIWIAASATQLASQHSPELGRAVGLYGTGMLLGLLTFAVWVLLVRDPDRGMFSIRSAERTAPSLGGRGTVLRLAGILIAMIPLTLLYFAVPDSQWIGDGLLLGFICGLGATLWLSFLR